MKWIFTAVSVAALSWASVAAADAKGCIKGAIVGGVAGHMAGHGKVGAAAGCAIGHHEANKRDPNNANAQGSEQRECSRYRQVIEEIIGYSIEQRRFLMKNSISLESLLVERDASVAKSKKQGAL